jgi:hypothetical protein
LLATLVTKVRHSPLFDCSGEIILPSKVSRVIQRSWLELLVNTSLMTTIVVG